MVGLGGLEPPVSCSQDRRHALWLQPDEVGWLFSIRIRVASLQYEWSPNCRDRGFFIRLIELRRSRERMDFLMLGSPSEVLNGGQRTPFRASRVQRMGKFAFYLRVPRAGAVESRQDSAHKNFKTKDAPASGAF